MATIRALIAGGAVATPIAGKPGEQGRPDCPGKIVCPITGDVICADQCPLEADAAHEVSLPVTDALPSCCAGRAANAD